MDFVIRIGEKIGRVTILIPTSDELSLFVAEHTEKLNKQFIFHKNDPALLKKVISKEGLYYLAKHHNVLTPSTVFPRSLDDVKVYAENCVFPVLLKGIHGKRLEIKAGIRMVLIF